MKMVQIWVCNGAVRQVKHQKREVWTCKETRAIIWDRLKEDKHLDGFYNYAIKGDEGIDPILLAGVAPVVETQMPSTKVEDRIRAWFKPGMGY